MATILENAEDLDITDAEAAELTRRGIIYRCEGGDSIDTKSCGDFFHIAAGDGDSVAGWAAVDAALAEIR